MRIYITKYAMTRGVIEAETDEISDSGRWVHVPEIKTNKNCDHWFVLGSEAFETYDQALVMASKMRQKQIEHLERKLNKIKNLSFESR
jgi:hypothetical protein